MTELNRAGQVNSLGHIDTIQKTFRDQIDVVSDELRQLAGNAEVPEEALNAPYLLYVNAYTGKDTYVSGDYKVTGNPEQRISLQRLECGYTEAAPFRTLSRACLEAAIITSRDYQDTASKQNALVSIVVMTGNHIIFNDKGETDNAANFPAWEDGKIPTDAELASFNSRLRGGVILPRGASLISLDLRKTILRPNYVPTPEDEARDLSNRTALIRVTGQCYCYGFTLRDKEGANYSHHLLTGFEYANQSELDEFYSKVLKTFGGLSAANAVPETGENQIVGPQPRNPVQAVDTTNSASPYIYNISIRSEWGFSGMLAAGDEATGFKSMVVAQYTGVSLQRDLSCWQKYRAGNWTTFSDYDDLISTDPDDVRANPARRSFHVRTTNNAVIQEVSVFAIGQSIHHLAESGSQITITNSNSNWGGCAALAIGFKDTAEPVDTPFQLLSARRSLSPFAKSNNIEKVFLGSVESGVSNSTTNIDLTQDLSESRSTPGQPDVVASKGYSLKSPDLLWIENPQGSDYQAALAATPWAASDSNRINIVSAVTTVEGDAPQGDNILPDIEGKRVYIRRMVDTRTKEERTYSLEVYGSAERRTPIRDYVLQPVASADWSQYLTAVSKAAVDLSETELTVDLVLKNVVTAPADFNGHSTTKYYRKGETILKDNKHIVALADTYGAFNSDEWMENYVHMGTGTPDVYSPGGVVANSSPLLVFDGDTDTSTEETLNCGFSLTDPIIVAQYESATDYRGLYYFLTSAGLGTTNLTPQELQSNRDISLSGADDIEFRRPSNIRLFGHAYEWAGRGNYSTGLPQYQGDMTQTNKFTYYFTNEKGGKVYASGFNEEGYAVTPQGLQDIETGEITPIIDIGAPDVEIPDPPELPKSATTVVEGLVELATLDEVRQAIAGSPPLTGESGPLVLQPNAIGSIIGAVGLLPPTQSILYVDPRVTRTSIESPATGTIPAEVQAEYDSNIDIHKSTAVEEVSFRSLPQALAFINGRSPLGINSLKICVFGESDEDRDIDCDYTSKVALTIQGATEDRTDTICYMGGRLKQANDAGELRLYDITLSATGTLASPNAYQYNISTVIANNGLILNNVTLKSYSTNYKTEGVTYSWTTVPPERAYTIIQYNRNYPTTVEFDLSASGNWNGRGGLQDNIFGDLKIEGRRGNNRDQNNLIFRSNRTDSSAFLHQTPVFGRMLFSLYGIDPDAPGGVTGYGNSDLKLTFDFGGTAATDATIFTSITRDMSLTTTSNTQQFEANLEVEVIRGALNDVKLFQISGGKSFQTIRDAYENNTATPVSSRVGAAFTAAGVTTVKPLTVPLWNTYNGDFVSTGGGEIAPVNAPDVYQTVDVLPED